MKKRKVLVAAMAAGVAVGASAAFVTDYEFNDEAGTSLSKLANGGLDTNPFWDNSAAFVNGSGNLVATNGAYIPHDLYDTAIASGVVTYEVGISSWNLTALASATNNVEPAMLELRGNGSHDTRMRLGLKIDNSGNVVIRSDGQYMESDIGLSLASSNGIRFKQVVDLDSKDWSISYQRYDDGDTWTTWGSGNGTWAGNKFEGISMMQSEGGTWSSTDQVSFDYLRVDSTAIPEPATLGLVGVCAATLLFIRRKFMI